MNQRIRQKLANRKRRIQRRLDQTDRRACAQPMMTARNIHDGIADPSRGLSVGGLGAIHARVRQLGLSEAIDRRLELLQIPRISPYPRGAVW